MALSWRSHLALPGCSLQAVRRASTAASLVLISMLGPAARVQAAPQHAHVHRRRRSVQSLPALAMSRPRRGRGIATRAWVALAIAVSLVLSQCLGLLHRTVDAPADAKRDQGQVVIKDTAGPTSEAGRFVASLVPRHDDAHHCDAFDRLSLGSALADDVTATGCEPAPWRLDSLVRPVGPASAESKHDFEARAPPGTPVVEPQRG
jgi:hypothetical protein